MGNYLTVYVSPKAHELLKEVPGTFPAIPRTYLHLAPRSEEIPCGPSDLLILKPITALYGSADLRKALCGAEFALVVIHPEDQDTDWESQDPFLPSTIHCLTMVSSEDDVPAKEFRRILSFARTVFNANESMKRLKEVGVQIPRYLEKDFQDWYQEKTNADPVEVTLSTWSNMSVINAHPEQAIIIGGRIWTTEQNVKAFTETLRRFVPTPVMEKPVEVPSEPAGTFTDDDLKKLVDLTASKITEDTTRKFPEEYRDQIKKMVDDCLKVLFSDITPVVGPAVYPPYYVQPGTATPFNDQPIITCDSQNLGQTMSINNDGSATIHTCGLATMTPAAVDDTAVKSMCDNLPPM